MEDINDIRGHLEEIGLTQSQIDEVLPLLVDVNETPAEKEASRLLEEELRSELVIEPDWRKRAAIAARLISLSLDK